MNQLTYKNVVVATTAVTAEYLEVSPDALKKAFSRNADNFKEGEHYYNVSHAEIKGDKMSPWGYRGNQGLRVFTRKGALRLTRFMRSIKADDLFDEMENTYFAVASKAEEKQLTVTELLAQSNIYLVDALAKITALENDALVVEAKHKPFNYSRRLYV